MRPEIEELTGWYQGRTGGKVAAALAGAVAPLIQRGTTKRLFALGYCAPVLEGFDPESVERLVLGCPAEQGGTCWPDERRNLTAEVDELALPFPDALFDQVLVIHALEHAAPVERLLRELWRVLAPGGSIVLVVPNRAGLWVHMETTPFGHGAPFGKNQLCRMLADAMFEVDHRQTLLAIPPIRPVAWMDRPVMKIAPRTGGLHIVRAVKCDGPAPLMVGRAAKRRGLFAPKAAGATSA
jgi:SAM-dependent methyltransferase